MDLGDHSQAAINIKRDSRYGNCLWAELPRTYKGSANTAPGHGGAEGFTQEDGRVVKTSVREWYLSPHYRPGHSTG